MKTIKNILLLLGVLALSLPAASQPRTKLGGNPAGVPKVEKHQARKVLHRTAIVVFHAHKLVKQNKNYTGDLARAIAHQRFAKKLYMRGKYHRAIHQSRLARLYALKAIKANKGTEIEECKMTPEEQELMKDAPAEADLISEMAKDNPGAKFKDEDSLISEPDIDLNADE